MIKKVYAVCLLVNNFEKSLDFYINTLGLPLKSRDGKYADFKIGETLLAIFQKDEATAMFPTAHMNSGGGCVYAYEVPNVEATCKSLVKKKVFRLLKVQKQLRGVKK